MWHDGDVMTLTVEHKLVIRAAVNDWVSANFPEHRRQLAHRAPVYDLDQRAWTVALVPANDGRQAASLGILVIALDGAIVTAPEPAAVIQSLLQWQPPQSPLPFSCESLVTSKYEFHHGDGITALAQMPDRSIDLLLTDPPYGISSRYTCETQVPRRLRKNGSDFIMPKGYFGTWDEAIDPHHWTSIVLPKVSGWAVTFCAQAQIGTYCDIFAKHGLVAVGPMVWQKTNPVPFNHKFKPVNAWEAIVVGKRPGTLFNGTMVHNVFVHKSPSPQQRIHPTQKPLPLLTEFVDLFSSPGELVVDPFAGSGTTVIAACQRGRRALAYELDTAIFSTAVKRLKTKTNAWGSDD